MDWQQEILNDVEAFSIDHQIQLINAHIAELAQKRYTSMLNATIFKDKGVHEINAKEATEAITKLRRQLADIRRNQAIKIKIETKRIISEAEDARKDLADSILAIREAEMEMQDAKDRILE